MVLNPIELANKIQQGLSRNTDKNDQPLPPASELQEYAKGFINALKAATVSNAPGTITGVVSPSGALSNGAGVGGLLVGLTPAPWLAKTMVGSPGPLVPGEKEAVIAYLTASSIIVFDVGTISGPSPASWGGTGGRITAVTGAACAAAVTAQTGLSGPDMVKHYTIMMDYIKQNLVVTYPPGSVTGGFPPTGGALAGGTGIGGTIS